MSAFRRRLGMIWQDIRNYRNLEFYLILVVVVLLFVFDIFGAPNDSAYTQVLLAAIAVLVYSQLDTRAKEQTIADKIDSLSTQIDTLQEQTGEHVQVFSQGRSAAFHFMTYLEKAQTEVVIVGISLTAFSQRFSEMPAKDFKDRIAGLLARGVNFKCLLLDPDADIAARYATDRNESAYNSRVERTKTLLSEISTEFRNANLAGTLDVYLYRHLPYCYLVLVDPKSGHGWGAVSHYLYATARAETPIYHFNAMENPALIEKYELMTQALLQDATQVTSLDGV